MMIKLILTVKVHFYRVNLPSNKQLNLSVMLKSYRKMGKLLLLVLKLKFNKLSNN